MSAISLEKGNRVSLVKSDGKTFDIVKFGANWGAIRKGSSSVLGRMFGMGSSTESVDLDLSAICYNDSNNEVETLYFGKKNAFSGAMVHSGDDLVGDTNGDDGTDNEVITVKLNSLPDNVTKIYFVLNSYQHHKFDELPHMGCKIYGGDQVLAKFDIKNDSGFNGKEALILGSFYKRNNEWKFKAEGLITNDRSISELKNTIKNQLL